MTATVYVETNAQEAADWLGLQARLLPKASRDAGNEIKRETLRLYRQTSATWHHQPEYEVLIQDEGSAVWALLAGTSDTVWHYVDAGTRPHVIVPRRAKVLAFPSGYHAKTISGNLLARGGGSFGDAVFSRRVMHPGFPGRGFTGLIQKAIEKLAPAVLLKYVKKWAAKKFPL